jgi:acetoacetyl-CoA synthetase
MTTPDVLWTPSPDAVGATMLHRYQDWLEQTHGPFASYAELWQWSVDEVEPFWASIWDFFDVQASARYERVLADGSHAMPGTRWFPGARLNYAEHVFRGTDDDAVAIRAAGEGREIEEITWAQLRTLTVRIAAGLRAQGVQPGDRVVAYLPNVPEAVAAVLACASIGAVWSSCSPDFGAHAVVDRFAQIEPKVLLAVDGYRYGGRDYDRRATVDGLRAQLPSLVATVLLPHLDPDATLDGTLAWADFLGQASEDGELAFAQVPFDHPLWVLYSSGTTGLPKAIVQGHGGILLEQLKHQHLHLDARPGDRVFWFTTTGWMMWNFLVGVLLTDASIVLYDGNPGTPDLGVLWQLAADAGITVFGASAGYVGACEKAGVQPADGRDLSALRAIGSTGSPLAPESFDWAYAHLGPDLWLFSTSGGSDVCTAFVGGVPTLPVTRGELQARALGARVVAFDPDGNELIGEVGELVLTEPVPSMPLYLWDDPDGTRLHEAYFDRFPGVWRHGDWIAISERGTAVISGRSDSTINRGGVRMGTSEIYRSVLALDEVTDALVVDVDGWMPLFVVLRDGAVLDAGLEQAIRTRVREDCSPRHVPNAIYAVAEVPRTLSGKVLEVPVKRILQGTPVERAASRDSLVNPAALDWFVQLAHDRNVSTLP